MTSYEYVICLHPDIVSITFITCCPCIHAATIKSENALFIIPEIGGNDFFYAYLAGMSVTHVMAIEVPAAITSIRVNLQVSC